MEASLEQNRKPRINPAYFFIAPALILVLLLIVYPTFRVAYLSVTKYSRQTETTSFVGAQNYVQLIKTPVFIKALKQTLTFSLASTAGHLILGFLLALAMNMNLNRQFIRSCRALILLPWSLSPIVVAIILQLWTYPLISPVAKILKALGSTLEFNPLGRSGTALWTLIGANIWQFTPFYMLMILAGLQTIDPELFEAAKIDGASAFQRVRYVVLSHLRNVLLTLTLFDLVTTAAYFDLIWVTTQGGPTRSTEVLATYIYRAGFLSIDWNRAATAGAILLIISIAVASIIVAQLRETE